MPHEWSFLIKFLCICCNCTDWEVEYMTFAFLRCVTEKNPSPQIEGEK